MAGSVVASVCCKKKGPWKRAATKSICAGRHWVKFSRGEQNSKIGARLNSNELGFARVANRKICAIRMMEDEGADAGFRVHHHPFGEVNSDFFGTQEEPDTGLVFEIRTSGIAEAVALAAIA